MTQPFNQPQQTSSGGWTCPYCHKYCQPFETHYCGAYLPDAPTPTFQPSPIVIFPPDVTEKLDKIIRLLESIEYHIRTKK